MNETLMAFPVDYMFYRRHGRVRKKLGVKTSFQAVEKPVVSKAELCVVSKAEPWFILKLENFKKNPCIFKNKVVHL